MAAGSGSAFVAGATGYTGRAVVKELATRGVEVIAHVRPDSPRLDEWRERFTRLGAKLDATPWQAEQLGAVMRDYRPAYVFGLLGTTQKRARKARRQGGNDSYESVDYGLTAMLLDATAANCPDAKFVYLSSLGVREGARNPYLAVRWRLESELERSGLRYVIAHPALITGTDREEFRAGERAVAVAVQGMFNTARWLGFRRFTQRFATLTGAQLGRALANAALDPALSNVTLEVPQLLALSAQ